MKYQNAASFRQALEARLNTISKETGTDLAWLRKQVAFDRLLARIFSKTHKTRWLVKGGYAMELRFTNLARTTKDIDLSIPFPASGSKKEKQLLSQVREELMELAVQDISDWFVYEIEAPIKELAVAPYGGARFPINVKLSARKFANFNLDVGMGDAVVLEPEWHADHNFLKFAEIASVKIPLLPKEQQFAEKIHTYSLPRDGDPNSRTRDLIDMVLLIEKGDLDAGKMKKAVQATFERRQTHKIPVTLVPPPSEWTKAYEALARDCSVDKKVVGQAFDLLKNYWEEIWVGVGAP